MIVLGDITRRKSMERRLKVTSIVFERSQDAIMISDADNRIIDVNPAFTSITGYSREEVLGRDPGMLSSGRQSPEFYQDMWRSLQKHGHWKGEIWNKRKNGEIYPEHLSINRVQLERPGVHYFVASFSDITDLKNHAEALERAAHYDELTGLPNRQLMINRLQLEMEHSDQTQEPLAICYLDLDGFKTVNDQVGQNLGDRALVTIASRLRLAIRNADTVARVGGDEFVLLLRNVGDERIYQRILAAVRQPLSTGPATSHLTASMGITLYPGDSSDSERLVRHADQAMYSAKEKGRNNYHFFDPSLDQSFQRRRQQLTELARALRQDEFELYYQPQVQLQSGALVGFEALVRWQHPERGLLAPGLFLPFVEGSHLEEGFGGWVLRRALAQQAEWFRQGLFLGVSINISASHLLAPGFVRELRDCLQDHPDPTLITLEILESTALDDTQRAGQVLNECRALGVQIALDDFGTGFSSLSYFRSLPVDTIKIDRSFTMRMLEDDSDRAIVESVVYMAQRFNRLVLAEGVETAQHAELLAALGCDQIQGFGLARPMPSGDVLDWVRQWQGRAPLAVPAFIQSRQ